MSGARDLQQPSCRFAVRHLEPIFVLFLKPQGQTRGGRDSNRRWDIKRVNEPVDDSLMIRNCDDFLYPHAPECLWVLGFSNRRV